MNKTSIIELLQEFVRLRQTEHPRDTKWAEPLAGFAAADNPLFVEFKRTVSPTHALPKDLLPTARTVVVFYLPFHKSIGESNIPGQLASKQWAMAYLETNTLINDICLHVKTRIEDHDHAAVAITPATHNFDPEKLISDWSHRHVAVTAGLGRLGLNNMLITESGCCGRLGSFVTSLELPPDHCPESQACLYLHNGSCQRCITRCVGDALFPDQFDRHKCYQACLRNEEEYQSLGAADVCGKCVADVPCAFTNPVRKLKAPSEQ